MGIKHWMSGKTRIINSIIRDIVGLAPTIEKMIGPRHRWFCTCVDRSTG